MPTQDKSKDKDKAKAGVLRSLPSVDEVLRDPAIAQLEQNFGHDRLVEAVRAALARLRHEVASGLLDQHALELALPGLAAAIERELRRITSYSLRPVINATGVILHTNLGRAPLSEAAIDHIREVATAYSNIELDLETGSRGKRDLHADRLFRQLLNAELDDRNSASISTIVVNNNAAAVLLALNTFADKGEVIVSRGELVEIGGSFRIPDVMSKSGAILKEVGTTNRTRISDYEQAITEHTQLLLRVHRSNFEITGFTEQPSTAELVDLARRRNIPLMEDLGSGALFDLNTVGIGGEPTVLDSLRAGVDVVAYSGDKLLGGPQAGIISGNPELIERTRRNPLFRALRVDKLTYAALEATLVAYLKGDYRSIPAVRMMQLSKQEIEERSLSLLSQISNRKLHLEIIDGESLLGGGAAPSSSLPTRLLAMTAENMSADELADRLRRSQPPIIARVEHGRVLLDLRTVFPEQDATIAAALNRIDN